MKRYLKAPYIYYIVSILAILLIIAGFIRAMTRSGNVAKEAAIESSLEEDSKDNINENKETAEAPNIRVLLMTDGYKQQVHPSLSVTAQAEISITYGDQKETYPAETELIIAPDDSRFASGNIRLQASEGELTINSINRGYGHPSYEGIIELHTTAEGIAVINELSVEQYLCRVVPSEMPASYEMEALKAQAVCARSYAYRQMEGYGYPEYEAHVNDSTDYQVYANSAPDDRAKQAVEETAQETVRLDGQVVTTYYYSTSCGKTTSMEAWGTAATNENRYLQSVEVKGEDGDYEKDLPWYQWTARIPSTTLSNLIELNTGTDIGSIQSLEITQKGPGGVALQIVVTGNAGTVTVETENKIRRALGGTGYEIERQDGSIVSSSTLLPSAFFTISKEADTYIISGGGYGHGIGMSQNGANEMAKSGMDYKEILTFFYTDVTIE